MPSLTISLFSWTKRRLSFGSICSRCLSYSSPISFHLIAWTTRSESCSTPIRASSLIAPKVYDALLIGIGAVSVMMILYFFDSSSRAFCLVCSFCNRISSSAWTGSTGMKKSCSSSATSADCRLTCFSRIVMSFRSFN